MWRIASDHAFHPPFLHVFVASGNSCRTPHTSGDFSRRRTSKSVGDTFIPDRNRAGAAPRCLGPRTHSQAARALHSVRRLYKTMLLHSLRIWAVATILSGTTIAQSSGCPTILTPSYKAPVVGSGWTAQLVANGLTKPRGMVFDTSGALLVVQQGTGILRMTFVDNGGTCLVVNETKTLVENDDVGSSADVCV